MTVRNEVNDPWGWLLAVFSGGLTWAALGSAAGPVGVLAGLGVGAAVFGTKVAVGSALNRKPEHRQLPAADALPKPPPNSPAAQYVERAKTARLRMADLAKLPGDAWLRAEVGQMDDGAEEVLAALRDLGGRVTLADQLIAAANGQAVYRDRETIAEQLSQTTDEMLAQERRRAVAALDEQLQGLQRLAGLRDQLLARMATAVVGLETVTTRMGEVVTRGTAALDHDRASDVIADASSDLEALRTGLAEAQQMARGVG